MRNPTKLIIFAILVGAFYWYAIMGDHGQDYVTARQRFSNSYGIPFFTQRTKSMITFIVGAWITLWGDKKIGTFEPISLRVYFIIIGIIVMGMEVLMMNMLNFY